MSPTAERFCLTASEAYESRRRTIVSLLVSLEKVGRYPYAPVHVQGSDLPPVASGQKKVPVFDAGTNASHDVNQV